MKTKTDYKKKVDIFKKRDDAETADEFIKDLENVITRVKNHKDVVESYSLIINFKPVSKATERNPVELLYDFKTSPERITSESELNEILRSYSDEVHDFYMDNEQFKEFMDSIFIIVVNVNYNGETNGLDRKSFGINELNTELEWMGIPYKVETNNETDVSYLNISKIRYVVRKT